MMRLGLVFLAGLLFSGGLIVSGMINPEKVIGFLNVAGDWDPSLAFVMAGAVVVNLIGHRIVTRRPHPLFATEFSLPTRTDVDGELVVGAALFGIGWGIAGFCPGPALAALGAMPQVAVFFVGPMLAGMVIARTIRSRRAPAAS